MGTDRELSIDVGDGMYILKFLKCRAFSSLVFADSCLKGEARRKSAEGRVCVNKAHRRH